MKHRVWLLTPGVLVAAVIATRCSPAPPPPSTSTSSTATAPTTSGLIAGLGAHHHPIVTSNPEAQKWFDQGFALVFSFNHEEAARSFQRAAELDPKAPMPWWGVAWALGPNYNLDIDDPRSKQASEAIARAKMLSAGGAGVEREYVEAMAVRYSPDPKADRPALARKYSGAMGDLMRRHPDDVDAATLYAESLMNLRPWKLWTLDGKPAPDTETIVAVLESVLRRVPNHLGANHFYIHAVEASKNPARALASAARLETLAPSAGHLVHMPAHIYARTGDEAAAAKANLAGAEADRVYLKTAPPGGFYGMAYYSHNLHFLADSEMMQGRFAAARKAAGELETALMPHADMMPMVESMVIAPTNVLLRFAKDADVLALAAPPANRPVMTAWWHFARGVALSRTGKTDEAVKERAALDAALSQVPDSALFGGTGLESAKTVLAIARTVLDARIAAARAARDEAVAHWTRAVAAADKLSYDEPPVWFYPIRESLGAALLSAGKPADAERVFREDLDRHPRNARALFGLQASLAAQGKTVDAAWVKAAFDEAWKNADTPLTMDAF